MPNDPQRFRDRAIECRAIAKGANEVDAALLEEIAEELEEVAAEIANQPAKS